MIKKLLSICTEIICLLTTISLNKCLDYDQKYVEVRSNDKGPIFHFHNEIRGTGEGLK